ncbi:MAG: hypothetical protein E7613_09865 [Ruminococcaceae bacterium]|nr:hypothetical protein [Oscillospiraceae bacterium]
MNYKKPSFWLIIVAVITAVVIAVTLMTSPKKDTPKPASDKQSEEKVEEKEEDKPLFIEAEIPFPEAELLNLHGKYVSPNFISPEEFDWGDYYPLLEYETSDGEYGYGVISKGTTELDGAVNSYCLYQNTGKSIFDIAVFKEAEFYQMLPDAFRSENLSDTNKYKKYYEGLEYYYTNSECVLENVGKTKKVSILSHDGTETGSLTKDFDSVVDDKSLYMTVDQFIDDRYILLYAFFEAYDYSYYYNRTCTMLFDIVTNEYTFLVGDAKEPILSPDRKYLAYKLDYIDEDDYTKSGGFYVLNIETGKTLYIECPHIYKHRFINWIPREEYESVVPDTSLKAELDNTSEEFSNDVVYLHSKDENTKSITIEFPSDFPYGPYSEENIVSPDEFDWGGWAVLGDHEIGHFTNSDTISDYVIISEKTADINDAISLYKSYNDKYLIKSPITVNDDLGSNIAEFLYDSRIVDISEDGSEVLRRTRTNNSKEGGDWYSQLMNGMWTDNYELLNDGVSQDYVVLESSMYDINSYKEVLYAKDGYPYKIYMEPSEYTEFWSQDYGELVTLQKDDKLLIYSVDTQKMLYEISLPYNIKTADGRVNSFDAYSCEIVDSRYLILEFNSYSKEAYYYDANFSLYRYDLESGEMLFLAQYASAYDYAISPDGKYIAYTSPMGYDYDLDWNANNLSAMKPGFYIRNLETGEIVAFHDTESWQGIMGFVNADSVHKTAESDVYYVPESVEQREDIVFSAKNSKTIAHSLNNSQNKGSVVVDKNIVSDGFDWGEYIPFVKYIGNDSDVFYTRAFLYSGAENITDAINLYNRIDGEYKDPFDRYESRVTYVSTEADKVGVCTRFYDLEEIKFRYNVWKGNRMIFEQNISNRTPNREDPLYDYSKEEFIPYVIYTLPEKCIEIKNCSNGEYKLYYNSDYTKLFAFSVRERAMIYELSLPVSGEVHVEAEYFSGGRYLILRMLSGKRIVYDLEKGSYVTLERLGSYSTVSPDGNYVLSVADGYGGDNEDAKHGFYICNLQTKETVYYPTVDLTPTIYHQYGNFINWVNEAKLLSIVGIVTPPGVTEPFSSILSSKNSFLLNNENRTFIKDFVFPYSGKGLMEDTSVQYTYVDFEGDGNNELVIRGRYGEMLILKANGNSYYGFTYDFRSMQTLYDDGTFAWNYTDAEGLHYGRAKLEFSDGAYKVTELCRTDWYKETGKHYFYVGDTEVDSYGLVMYEGNYSNQEAVFYSLNDNAETVLDFDHQSDSVTLTYAPRNQSIFPISFEYDGKKITVNKPIFTGIPTNSVYSYKDDYAFENGINVFGVSIESGYKYVAVNKEGKIVDTDHSESHISDVSAIITREDLAMHMTGVPGNYKQQLLGGPGSAESEKFDGIGYFYNGIAPVIRDGKIGFVGANCKTLLEPCIEIDDLRYPPDYKGYRCDFLTEDAIVLPIDGEFAIINLTREDIPEIREPFWSVLKGDTPMNSGEKEVYFTDMYDYDSKKFIDKSLKYAFVDMNSDGKKELLVRGLDTVILRDTGDGVSGFAVNFRALAGVHEDGTFGWNDMASDGLHYGVAKYNTDWTVTELFSIHEDSENNVTRYFIREKEVTKAEYDENESKYSTKAITFYTLDYEKLK